MLWTACMIVALWPAAAPAEDRWDPWPADPRSADEIYSAKWLNSTMNETTNPATLVGLLAIRGYQQVLSPALSSSCQFYPSCSRFTFAAVASQGLLNGLIMGADRVSRCHTYAILSGYPRPGPNRLLADPPEDMPVPFPWLSRFGF